MEGRLLVAFGLAAGAVVAASATAQASTDLAGLLPDPPASGWTVTSGKNVLAGPFTAASYAAWVNQGSSPSSPTPAMDPADLTSLGFVAGYAKEWWRSSTDDVLAERVFQFGSASGADEWYTAVKQETLQLASHIADISGASEIPNSFGVVLSFGDGDQWRLDFREANLVFVVHADSFAKGEDLSDLALGQARIIYATARSSPPQPVRTADHSLLVAGSVVIGAVVAITLLVLVVLIATHPWRRTAQPVTPPGAYLSPDGHYWWDGATWRPTDPGPTGA